MGSGNSRNVITYLGSLDATRLAAGRRRHRPMLSSCGSSSAEGVAVELAPSDNAEPDAALSRTEVTICETLFRESPPADRFRFRIAFSRLCSPMCGRIAVDRAPWHIA